MKSELLKVFTGADIYFEKKNAVSFINAKENEKNIEIASVFGAKQKDFIENAPDFMFCNDTKIFFVVDLEPKISDLKEAVIDARKKFNIYHYAAFFNKSDKSKLVLCLLIVKKEHFKKLKETLQSMISEKDKQYNWIEETHRCSLGEYQCIALRIDIFYIIARI